MRSPYITAFDNGIIKWSEVGNGTYILSVNGKTIQSDGATDGLYHGNTFDTNPLEDGARIQITAVEDGERIKDSATVTVVYDKKTKSLSMVPVEGCKVSGETLSWTAAGGAAGYKAVDLDYNAITLSSSRTRYDMSTKNIILGVFPISNTSIVKLAEVAPTVIKYLDGDGTADNPYLIKTPFDLRTIDYYEALYAEGIITTRNHYRIENNIDYNAVRALESDSNVFTLRKPFFGRLDGNGKRLMNFRVHYDGGFWALINFMAKGSIVKDIIFDNPAITNRIQDMNHPINASVAMVCNRNYGTITGVTVTNADYTAAGGEVCGIALHNYGTVSNCTVSGVFKQESTMLVSQACYEMAGIVVENCAGGTVSGCKVTTLTLSGSQCEGEGGGLYNNVRTAAGIVSVNRAGGTVSDCAFTTLAMTRMLDFYDGTNGGYEWGGIVAYNAGTVSGGSCGTMRWGADITAADSITKTIGSGSDLRGQLVGKNDGTVE